MRKTILTAAAAAIVLSTAGSGLALAQVSPGAVKSASEKKDPVEADAAGAKVAADKADQAAKDAATSNK